MTISSQYEIKSVEDGCKVKKNCDNVFIYLCHHRECVSYFNQKIAPLNVGGAHLIRQWELCKEEQTCFLFL
jgi:hypothetical protein